MSEIERGRASSPHLPSGLGKTRRLRGSRQGAIASRASRSRARSTRVARACDGRLHACRGRPTPAHHRQSRNSATEHRTPLIRWFLGSMVVVILRTCPSCLSVPMLLVILGVCAAALSRLSFLLWELLAEAREAQLLKGTCVRCGKRVSTGPAIAQAGGLLLLPSCRRWQRGRGWAAGRTTARSSSMVWRAQLAPRGRKVSEHLRGRHQVSE